MGASADQARAGTAWRQWQLLPLPPLPACLPAVREVFRRVAAAQPQLMQAGSEQLTPVQLAALQQIFQQQPAT